MDVSNDLGKLTKKEYKRMFDRLLDEIESNELLEYLYAFCREMVRYENNSHPDRVANE